MPKHWYLYCRGNNIGIAPTIFKAFGMLEELAGRKWSKETDICTDDRISLDKYEAKLEILK